jgi:hypothetical protein
MYFLSYVPLICLFADVALSGSLIIINNDGQCMVWSESNYGCTGYSAPFARLDGKNCSSRFNDAHSFNFQKTQNLLDFAMEGILVKNETVKLDICGKEHGRQVAWVDVKKDGTVSFLNQQGNTATCTLDDGFNVGSKCSVTANGPSQSATRASAIRQSSIVTPTTSQSGASASMRSTNSFGSSSGDECTCVPARSRSST